VISRIETGICGLRLKQETQPLGLPELQAKLPIQTFKILCIIIMVLLGWLLEEGVPVMWTILVLWVVVAVPLAGSLKKILAPGVFALPAATTAAPFVHRVAVAHFLGIAPMLARVVFVVSSKII